MFPPSKGEPLKQRHVTIEVFLMQLCLFSNLNSSSFIKQQLFNPFPKKALVFTCLQYKSFEYVIGWTFIEINISLNDSDFVYGSYLLYKLRKRIIKVRCYFCWLMRPGFEYGVVCFGSSIAFEIICFQLYGFHFIHLLS